MDVGAKDLSDTICHVFLAGRAVAKNPTRRLHWTHGAVVVVDRFQLEGYGFVTIGQIALPLGAVFL